MKREFHVKTPMGDLHIYAKHENSDVMADYPGVYVELLREVRGLRCRLLRGLREERCAGRAYLRRRR